MPPSIVDTHLSDVGLTSKGSLGTPRSPLRMEEFSGDAFPPGRTPPRPTHCVSSATIAFAKSQTLTIAEMDRLEAAGTLRAELPAQDCSSATPLESESPSSSPVQTPDVGEASCKWHAKAGDAPVLGEGYSEYNDFASESDCTEPESTGRLPCDRESFGQLSRLLGTHCQSDSSLQSEDAEVAGSEARTSDLSQLKSNLATRLSLSMTACSAQIWKVFAQMTDLLSAHVAAAAKDLATKAAKEMKERFRGLLHVKELPMCDVEGRVSARRGGEA